MGQVHGIGAWVHGCMGVGGVIILSALNIKGGRDWVDFST